MGDSVVSDLKKSENKDDGKKNEDKEFDAWLCSRTPANRWGDPKELVGAAVFLASRASDYVNGHVIFVDGGLTGCV